MDIESALLDINRLDAASGPDPTKNAGKAGHSALHPDIIKIGADMTQFIYQRPHAGACVIPGPVDTQNFDQIFYAQI